MAFPYTIRLDYNEKFIYKKGVFVMNEILHVGLDVGSTTVKIIVMNNNKNTI